MTNARTSDAEGRELAARAERARRAGDPARARELAHGASLAESARVQLCLQAGCRLNPRRKRPNAYQLLLNPPGAA